jgi:RimJ/RimL family protein N-acetyltransferase
VYLRIVEPSDAKHGQSWAMQPLLPRASTWYENWIKEKYPEERRMGMYIILRKDNDVPVGSLRTYRWDPTTWIVAHVDPMYGERAALWKAEALAIAFPWLGIEHQRPRLSIWLGAHEDRAIEAIIGIGAREIVRFREQIRTSGGRGDTVGLEFLNPTSLDRLGDPATIELPRSGTGEPRPVPGPVSLDGDPPANAVKVGERVYLRPRQKSDAPIVAALSRQEPDVQWDAGRSLRSGPGYTSWVEGDEKEDVPSSVRFAVCLRETDELIGQVGISDIDRIHGYAESESEIFRDEYRGGGFGSEAKHLLFDYAFNTLGLHSLQSFVIFPNTRSAAALRKQGYHDAGRMHWVFPSFGKFENIACFDLLASDWRAMPRSNAQEDGAL